ncbi:MAG: helix-turn-helix transcriptional regulator [Calditrichaeota bacterium]|nr:helix-turn-helix transcriptional regulator [Calditrichota bacterium]
MAYDFSNEIKTQEVTKRVDEIRRQLGFNQEQFAAALKISQAAVSKYLRERIPPAETLLRLARLANTTVEWILLGEKNYFYSDLNSKVNDNSPLYASDYDIELAKKIALLPADIRQSLLKLIDFLGKTGQK